MYLQAVASDIDKEEKAIKAGINRSELIYDATPGTNESMLLKDSWVANSKNSSKMATVDDIKIIMEGKGVDDDYLTAVGRRQKTSRFNLAGIVVALQWYVGVENPFSFYLCICSGLIRLGCIQSWHYINTPLLHKPY